MTILSYYSHDTVSSSKLIYEAPTNFPAVVICNLNAYDGDIAREAMNEILISKNITQENSKKAIDFVEIASENFKSFFEAEALENNFDLYFNGFYLSQMLISCKYQGIECTIEDFVHYHDYNYGNCYRFNGIDKNTNVSNSGEIRMSKKAGWKNGLQLELYVGDIVNQQQYTFKSGMRVIIHNQSVTPFADEDGIDVSVGQQTNIGISRLFINHLPYPYSNCVKKIEDHLNSNNFFAYLKNYYEITDYRQNFCLKACFQKFLISFCGCFDLKLPRQNNSSNISGCVEVNKINCIRNGESIFYNSSEIDKCYMDCPTECSQVIYDTKISTAGYPAEWYKKVLFNDSNFMKIIENTEDFDIEKAILMVNVFYDQMYYTVINEAPAMTFEYVIGFIGGNFGLFVGISILSLVEIVEILFYLTFMFIKRRANISINNEVSP